METVPVESSRITKARNELDATITEFVATLNDNQRRQFAEILRVASHDLRQALRSADMAADAAIRLSLLPVVGHG